MKKYLLPAIITLTILSVLILVFFSATNKSSVDKPSDEDLGTQSNEPGTSHSKNDLVESSNSNNETVIQSSAKSKLSGSNTLSSAYETPQALPTPEYTFETRDGQPLEEFPFEIMTEPPHSFHDPVTDFASVINNPAGTYLFTLPETTSSLGLYGRFWLSPAPLPAAHSPTAAPEAVSVLEAIIASRRVQEPSFAWLSAVELTVIVAAALTRENVAKTSATDTASNIKNLLCFPMPKITSYSIP